MNCSSCGAHRDSLKLRGRVEIEVRRKGVLIEHLDEYNIIFYQGNSQIIETLATISPTTLPRIINRMAIGDQGTIPADPSVPKVPTKDLPQQIGTSGLYHEVFRKDIQSRIITVSTGSTFVLPCTLTFGSVLVSTATTTGLASGMSVVGLGIPSSTVIANVNDGTHFTMSNTASLSGSQSLTIAGAANQVKFITTFAATEVPTSAYSNPSQPRVNEVGLVIINPVAPAGIARPPVTSPDPPPSDEVVMSLRTFKSVPFEISNDISITIRYTIFME